MRKWIRLLAGIAWLSSSPARADEWTWKNTLAESLFAAAVAIDVGQTTYALRSVPGAVERNPVLGPHPSSRGVLLAGLAGAAAHLGVSLALKKWAPAGHCEWWQSLTFGAEVGVVVWNYRTINAGPSLAYRW